MQIDLPIIFHFEAQLGYNNSKVFILSKYLSSVSVNPNIFDTKLIDNLKIGRVKEVA